MVKMCIQYDKPLKTNCFRLFKLESGDEVDDLSGTLETYPRNAAPPFEALSYEWGPSNQNHNQFMKCNGKDFSITKNLNAALRRLRLTSGPRYLWIDQICIDQTDKDERTEQVKIMKDIYSKASMVNAWLGSAELNQAVTAAIIIFTLANMNSVPHQSDHFPTNQELQKLGLPARESPAWNALNAMLCSSYFKRVWIIQELAVAQNFVLIWGIIAVTKDVFDSFKSNANFLDMYQADSHDSCPQLHMDTILTRPGNVKLEGQDLFDLVSQASAYRATDQRDKIFALIGLAGERPYNIMPDYNKSEAEVFTEFASNTISTTMNLKILSRSYVVDPCQEDRRPLWVPRWHCDDRPHLLNLLYYDFKASNDLSITRKESGNAEILALRGLRVDAVKDTSDQIKEFDDILMCSRIITQHQHLLEDRYGPEIIRPFLLTMIAGREKKVLFGDHRRPPTNDTYLDIFSILAASVLRKLVRNEASTDHQRAVLLLFLLSIGTSASTTQDDTKNTDSPDNADNPDDADDHLTALLIGLRNRVSSLDTHDIQNFKDSLSISLDQKFFITEKGYIGIGPPSLKPGDCVCVLYGGSVPYIVRSTSPTIDNNYCFVGSSYVQGIMDGEAIAQWKKEGERAPKDREIFEEWFYLE